MRENKFRGRCLRENWWACGDLIHRGEKVFIYNDYNEYEMEVDEETIGQYAGAFDKNTVDIYEGDIVRFNNQVGEVVFENGSFGIGFNDFICWKRLEWDYKDSQIDDNILPACYNDHFISFAEIYEICCDFDEVEVIGNIHNNHELLKGELKND